MRRLHIHNAGWILSIKSEVSQEDAKTIIDESKQNFAEHFNKGWLDYRKSVTEAGDWACCRMERQRRHVSRRAGARIHRLPGWLWHDGPGLVAIRKSWHTVRAQLNRTPMPSQELIDPLRGVLARLIAQITPGDIKYSFFCRQRHRGSRRGDQAGENVYP